MNILSVDLSELATAIHENAKAKGFWEKQFNQDEKIMLIISELGEALEAHRKNKFANIEKYNEMMAELVYLSPNERREKAFKDYMKDTFQDELADTAIRLLDLAAYWNMNLKPLNDTSIYIKIPQTFASGNVGFDLLFVTKAVIEYTASGKASEIIYLLYHIAKYFDSNLLYHIKEKMWYNSTRQRMHGKSY